MEDEFNQVQEQPEAIDLRDDDLAAFVQQLQVMFQGAKLDRSALVELADEYERVYNLEPYKNSELPFEDSLSIRLPIVANRVDRVASEIANAFDRDGSPVFKCSPQSKDTLEIAGHAEKQIHEMLVEADAMTEYRLAIKRALKVGVSFVYTGVVSRPLPADMQEPDGVDFENALEIRCVKLQDMYVYPLAVRKLEDAAFIGERMQVPMWKFREYTATGWYSTKLNERGEYADLPVGILDTEHGIQEDLRRLGVQGTYVTTGTEGDLIDIISGYIRFKPEGQEVSEMYHVVFPVSDPTMILRCRANPYSMLDSAPYTAWVVDEGDGAIIGRAYPKLLAGLGQLMDTMSMLRVENVKRLLSQVWTVLSGSMTEQYLQNKKLETYDPENPYSDVNIAATGYSRIMPDEVIPVRQHDELKGIPLAQTNPTSYADEQRLQSHIDEATIPTSPMSGIRSAFEVRNAAAGTSAKLKGYLKVVAATGFRKHIRQVQAQVWEYLMPEAVGFEGLRYIEYGDTSNPVNRSDYFRGIKFEPSGTVTSADEVIAMTSSADALNQLVPLFLQVPGIVPDVPKAIRELVKRRLKDLGMENYEEIIGLSEPTQADMQKNLQYLQALKAIGEVPLPPQNAMGGDGGIPLGLQSVDKMNPSEDRMGGAQTGVQENNAST